MQDLTSITSPNTLSSASPSENENSLENTIKLSAMGESDVQPLHKVDQYFSEIKTELATVYKQNQLYQNEIIQLRERCKSLELSLIQEESRYKTLEERFSQLQTQSHSQTEKMSVYLS